MWTQTARDADGILCVHLLLYQVVSAMVFHVLCRRCTAAQRACWIRRKPQQMAGVLGAPMEWLAVVSTGNSLWAHRWIWKKPMKMIGQSGGQETSVVTQQKTLKTHGLSWKWWSLFFASKKAGFQQVKHINLSQFKGGQIPCDDSTPSRRKRTWHISPRVMSHLWSLEMAHWSPNGLNCCCPRVSCLTEMPRFLIYMIYVLDTWK